MIVNRLLSQICSFIKMTLTINSFLPSFLFSIEAISTVQYNALFLNLMIMIRITRHNRCTIKIRRWLLVQQRCSQTLGHLMLLLLRWFILIHLCNEELWAVSLHTIGRQIGFVEIDLVGCLWTVTEHAAAIAETGDLLVLLIHEIVVIIVLVCYLAINWIELLCANRLDSESLLTAGFFITVFG